MKSNLQKKLILMSKLCIYGMIIQLSMYTLVFALDSEAQQKSVNEIQVQLNFQEPVKLQKVLAEVEKSTDFHFAYMDEHLSTSSYRLINLSQIQTLGELLLTISKQTDLAFRRRNSNIYIIKRESEEAAITEIFDQTSISGQVTDENGEGLPGATVQEKSTTNGTITDVEGNFQLSVSPDATLTISFVGYRTQEIPINGRSVIDVSMTLDAEQLDEVVVVGYGEVRKSDLTSAIAKIDGEALRSRPVATVDQALQGQLAGVHVQKSGGKPGKNATIRVRGVGSITAGNDPLYVIDGFPVDAETFGNMGLSNIESIEVLKDAASTAIYGSRGSNGVVIITTRRGNKGQGLKLDINAFTGVSNLERKLDFMTAAEYVSYMADARDDGYMQHGGDPNVLPINRPVPYERYYQEWIDDPESVPSYDHMDAITKTGITQSYQLVASGSANNTRFMVSGEYFNQTGIVKNTGYTRYSFRSNIDLDLNDFLKIGLNIAPTYSVNEDKDTEGKGGIIHAAVSSVPVLPSRLGYWGESPAFSDFPLASDIPRALAIIEHLEDIQTRSQILSSVFAEFSILSGLKFKTSFGANYSNTRRDRFQNQIIVRTGAPNGENWDGQSLNWINENILSYNKSFGKSNIGIIAGFTSQKQEDKSSYIRGTGFANDYVPTLNAASSWVANTGISAWSLLSYLSRATYSFADKYLLTASIRRDGSSRFGANTKWGWFPSISGGWRIDQEEFMKSIDIISQTKLRVSWGKTGNNNIGNYSSIASMGTSAYLLGVGESIISGAQPSNISNPNLGWERTATVDLGLDLGLFDGRVTLSTDYYNSQTSDLLLNVPVTGITGFTNEIQNIGKVENKGWEFELSTINTTGVVRWSSNINFSINENKVLQLGKNNAPIITGDWWDNSNITTVGHPIGSFYVYKQIGVYNTQEEIDATPHANGSRPGDVIIEDFNDDGIINADDRQIFGSNIPKYYFGVTNKVNYKGLELSVFLHGLGGNQIFNSIGREFDRPGDSHKNHYAHWANRWRSPEEPGDGMTPRATNNATGASNEWSNRYLYDGSFLRLRNITLGYTFPNRVVEKLHLANLRVYVQGENLYIWDDFAVGFTPEVDLTNGDPTKAGRDYGVYPTSRTFLFGINVSF